MLRCEWGLQGLLHLAPSSDALVVVDVLSFSTAVDITVARGAIVWPYRWKDESAARFAEEKGAVLASGRGAEGAGTSRQIAPQTAGSETTPLDHGR